MTGIPRTPKYRLHKPSQQAVVTLSGRDFYLGPYGTATSKAEYDRVVGVWKANGRRLPDPAGDDGPGMLVKELILAYWEWAQTYYRKRGRRTSQVGLVRQALKPLRELYGEKAARSFTAEDLYIVRRKYIADGLCRGTCNAHVDRIKRMFRWAAEPGRKYVPETIVPPILALKCLPKDRSEAREHERVEPVPAAHVEAVLAKVRPKLAAMIRLQLATAMRPGELCIMRPCDIDRSGPVWTYRPSEHKTEHRGMQRVVYLGPRAQEILEPFLGVAPTGFVFHPTLSERPDSIRVRKGKRFPAHRYTPKEYRRNVERACQRAGVPVWSPNQLRHSAATAIRATFGLEVASLVLGHARVTTTETYARRDESKALEAMRAIG